MKICVYAICHNEEKHVDRFMEASIAADYIVVSDTGSTDSTLDLLAKWTNEYPEKIIIHRISIKPWRFDDARNACLALLPEDAEVCCSMDLDEVLQPGWKEEIERIWIPGQTTRMRYGFDWGCGIAFQYEKFHARHGYRWWHPAHEYPIPDRIEEKWVETYMLLNVHKPDSTKSRGQYLDLLRVSIEEDPHCPRNAFYYGRELSFNGRWQEAITQLERYLALPRAMWANERCYAMRTIGRCYEGMNDLDNAMIWFRRSCSEAPGTREPWVELALCCYRVARWPECLGAAMTALDIKSRENVYTMDPSVWEWKPHDLASLAAWNLGLYDLALEQAKLALSFAPDDFRLRQNLKFCEDKVKVA